MVITITSLLAGPPDRRYAEELEEDTIHHLHILLDYSSL